MKKLWKHLYSQRRPQPGVAGQGLVEYALLLALIALVAYLILQALEPSIGNVFSAFVARAPVAPPSLINYTPPPTYTPIPPVPPGSTPTETPTETPTPTNTPTATNTPTPTQTASNTPVPPCPIPGPYGVPGRVQMENFRCGGPGVAFLDSTASGPGSFAYRLDGGPSPEGPDLALVAGGYYLGWITPGEWVEYEVTAPATVPYLMTFRYAAPNNTTPALSILVSSGAFPAGPFNFTAPPTGGWDTWSTASVQISLFAGVNRIRITGNTAGTNANYDYFDIAPGPTPTVTHTPLPSSTPAPSITPPPPTATPLSTTFYSLSTQDGRVRSDGNINSAIAVGDTGSNLEFRGFLSFNTAPLPDNATITSAILRIYQTGSNGNPNALAPIFVDIALANCFSANCTLQAADFGAMPAAFMVASYSPIGNGNWGQTNLNAAGRNNINKAGTTQFRLYFAQLSNNGNADNISIASGPTTPPTNAAQLIVHYTVP